MKYIVALDKMTMEECKLAGGKGASLARLTKEGFCVPKGAVILASAWSNGNILSGAEAELLEYCQSLYSKVTYAVRSSALNEDGEQASFAGAYETLTNVKKDEIITAVNHVIKSADVQRVKQYADSMKKETLGIAVVIQEFVLPSMAGVLFTSDVISGSSSKMVGNYVYGEGERLVSGQENAKEFTIDAFRGRYKGPKELDHFVRQLYKTGSRIRASYGGPMDIEWAISKGKLYILQARPITTLRRLDSFSYSINGSKSGEYLLSKTNVGEIFMCPVSPVTFSLLESINEMLGVPGFIDNVEGQAYCNLSVVCSALVSFGITKRRAYSMISDIAGKIPEGVEVPVFPFDKKNFLRKMRKIVFSGRRKKQNKMSTSDFLEKMPDLSMQVIDKIKSIETNEELLKYWNYINDDYMPMVLSTIMKVGPMIGPLLSTRKKLKKVAGEELAASLCAGSTGVLESMKPLLLLEDVIADKITKEDYIKECGHRSANEMELARAFPYENPSFIEKRIEEHKKLSVNIHQMQKMQENNYKEALDKFYKRFPNRILWLQKRMEKYVVANQIRESVRSKAVWLFCIFRELLLQVARLNNLGDDVFMLYFSEVLSLLNGDKTVLDGIYKRRENYVRYCNYPSFPNIIYGKFEPEKWCHEEHQRVDFYSADGIDLAETDIKGYPGAAGLITGKVRVIKNLDEANQLEQGEILVTTATNIGWTVIFPKAAAIVTDIGAPLSHAAIVAREFGIPAVVGCGNATERLHSGDLITVNGSKGSIMILTKK